MSENTEGAAEKQRLDQEAIAATQGLGLKGIGQPKPNEPAPVITPKGEEDIKPAPKPGTGTAPVVDPVIAPAVAPQAAQQANTGAAPIEIKSPLGAKTFGDQGGVVLSSFDDVQAYAKEKGIELKDVDSFRQVITQIKDLQQQNAEMASLKQMVTKYQTQFGGLPPAVANIVDAAINGQDYNSIIKDVAAGASLDFSRKFSEHTAVSLIRQYAQPGVTQESFDELTQSNKDALIAVAQTKYETDQTKYNKAIADNTASKQAFEQANAQSIETALANLREQFPTMDAAALKVVKDRMEFGLVDSLFNPDNTYKPDAGVKIAMQEFGQDAIRESYNTIGELAQKMRSSIQGETHEKLVQRSDTPDQQGRQVADQTNVIADTVQQQTKFLKTR